MSTHPLQSEDTPDSPRDVDLGGDINLLCGPPGCQVRLRASKALLSIASPYFHAMFNAFSESTATENGQDIELNEDEPDAVANLLKILHMKFTLPRPMSALELLALGVVADKYGCVQALSLSLEALCPREVPGRQKAGDMINLVVASYLLDRPQSFTKYTKCLIMDFSEPMMDLALLEMAQRVPSLVWLTIESRRVRALKQLMSAVSYAMKRPCLSDFAYCSMTAEWYSRMTINLRYVGLDQLVTNNKTITDLYGLAKSLTVASPNYMLPSCTTSTVATNGTQAQRHGDPTTQAEYNEMLVGVRKECVGLCLDCVRAGGRSQGNCRVKHA